MRPWTFSKKPCWCDCSFLFMFILSVPSPSAIENAETRGEERKWRAPEGSDAVTNCGNSKIDRDLSKWNRDCLSCRTPLSRESSLEFVGGISPFWWELWLQDLSWSFFFFLQSTDVQWDFLWWQKCSHVCCLIGVSWSYGAREMGPRNWSWSSIWLWFNSIWI